VIDEVDIHWSFFRFQFQAELLLERFEIRGTGIGCCLCRTRLGRFRAQVYCRIIEREVIPVGEIRTIHNVAAHSQRKPIDKT